MNIFKNKQLWTDFDKKHKNHIIFANQIAVSLHFTLLIFSACMFDIHQLKLEFWKENEALIKNISLDNELDCYILVDAREKKISTLALNTLLDAVIGNISKSDTYKDFSRALETVNHMFKTRERDGEKIGGISIFIWIRNKETLTFSTVGTPSGYLIKRDGEIIEITDKNDTKKEFSFISSGDINDGETIILSSSRLLDYLSKTDIRESVMGHKSETIGKHLEQVLSGEELEDNMSFIILRNTFFGDVKSTTKMGKYGEIAKYAAMKGLDNIVTKRLLASLLSLKEKISHQGRLIKNLLFVIGILVSFVFLYGIISSVISSTGNSQLVEESKKNLNQAREFIRIANENIANPDLFDLNMKKAEDLVADIKEKQLFLNDINKILEDITVIKKQFNGVQAFEEDSTNLITNSLPKDSIKILREGGRTYILGRRSITGPVIPGKESKTYTFDTLDQKDFFKDAEFFGTDIVILTEFSKLVNFSKTGYFRYLDTIGQPAWEDSLQVDSFYQNIYLLNKEKNQIIKHKKKGENYEAGSNFLTPEDSKNIGKILSFGVDGGMYLLKQDLSMIKAFSSPKYRLEKLIINKLPKNYSVEGNENDVELKVRQELSYVYLLLNNKIWVFKPNTTRYTDTKSLTYLGQIEGKKFKIKDFYVGKDGQIDILNDDGVYRLEFEVSDDKLIVR